MFLDLVQEDYKKGGYYRKQFEGYNLFRQFQYQEFTIDVTSASRIAKDSLAKQLLASGMMEQASYDAYIKALDETIGDMGHYEEDANEDVYSKLCTLRGNFIDEKQYKIFLAQQVQEMPEIARQLINQRALARKHYEEKACRLFYISDLRFTKHLIEDLKAIKEAQICILLKETKAVYEQPILIEAISVAGIDPNSIKWLYDRGAGYTLDFSCVEADEAVQQAIDTEQAFLMGYGEEALCIIKQLKIDAMIQAVPSTIYTKALTNIFSEKGLCTIYVPKFFNIYKYVKIIERTKLSYYHLAQLVSQYGEEIYKEDVTSLEAKYPAFFINIYEDYEGATLLFDQQAVEATGAVGSHISDIKDQVVHQYFKEQQGVAYLKGYFKAETLEEIPIDWDTKEKQEAVLVNGILVERAHEANILEIDPELTTRYYFRTQMDNERVRLVSNFLFFSTPKILELHNVLRKAFPQEQIKETTGHMDYKMYYDAKGKRREAFTLYNKPCIAMCEDGTFRIFPFKLEGGMLEVNGYKLRWQEEQVNPEEPSKGVAIYTPYLSKEDMRDDFGMKESTSYKKMVGKDRLNLVIIGTEIYYIKRGAVMLPCNGVVVSLDKVEEAKFLSQTKVVAVAPDYYNVQDLYLNVQLDCPHHVCKEDWASFKWAYGGAISLIANGEEAFDEASIASFMKEEGWATPLSMQTQESDVHTLSVHPRTAIGVSKKGELFILIYSGRTLVSKGVNYIEMMQLAKKMIPDIAYMINADGGGSSMLGMLKDKSFMELSYPSASDITCTGMARNIKTIFSIEI